MKRFISLLIVVLILVSTIPAGAIDASTYEEESSQIEVNNETYEDVINNGDSETGSDQKVNEGEETILETSVYDEESEVINDEVTEETLPPRRREKMMI